RASAAGGRARNSVPRPAMIWTGGHVSFTPRSLTAIPPRLVPLREFLEQPGGLFRRRAGRQDREHGLASPPSTGTGIRERVQYIVRVRGLRHLPVRARPHCGRRVGGALFIR